MVTKKRSGRKAAPRRRAYAARRAAPRRRAKSGITYIPSAMATAALVAVNVDNIKQLTKAITNNGAEGLSGSVNRLTIACTSGNSWITNKAKAFIAPKALVMDGVALAGGYLAGEIVKKYAPGVVKRPLGKIAKKIPKVI